MMTLTCIGNYITCNAASTGCGDQTACLSTLQQAMGPQLLGELTEFVHNIFSNYDTKYI